MQTSGPGGLSLDDMAVRVASLSVEAGRKGRKTRKKRGPVSRRRPDHDPIPTVSEDVLASSPEYAVRVELDITADFEGNTSKSVLVRKVKAELLAAVKDAMTSVARGLNLKSSGASVRPLKLEVDVNDA